MKVAENFDRDAFHAVGDAVKIVKDASFTILTASPTAWNASRSKFSATFIKRFPFEVIMSPPLQCPWSGQSR